MTRLLLILGATAVAILTALFAVPPLVDWNGFRGVLEEEASRALGREVRVTGKVDLRILPMPYVQFDNVSVSDARGITGAPFLEAKSFRLWLSVGPLLKGAFEARRIEVDEAEIRIRIDESGGGNWQTLRIDPRLASFVPTEVALQAVEFNNARIAIEGPGEGAGRKPIANIEAVSGELSAPSLSGPFKFLGSVGNGATRQQLRLSVSEIDGAGRSQLRAQLSGPTAGGATISVDGIAEDFAGKPKFTGALTMTGGRGGQVNAGASNGDAGGHELKSTLAVDSFGATLGEIQIAFEQNGRPQLMTGDARADWRTGGRAEARLASRWLDLDRISGLDASKGPLAVLDRFASGLGEVAAAPSHVRLMFRVDQATVAGEVVSNLAVDLVRADGRTTVESARVGLPGGSFVHASGDVLQHGAATGFNGHVLIQGRSRTRFLAWASKGLAQPVPRPDSDGPFQFDGKITSSPDLAVVADASIALDGEPVLFSASFRRGSGPSFLNLALSGNRLDLSGLARGALAPKALVAWLQARGLGKSAPSTTRLQARLDDLTDGEATYRNVDLDLTLENGVLSIGRLSGTLGGDARLAVKGRLDGLDDQLAGSLQGVVAAANPAGIRQLSALFEAVFGHPLLPTGLTAEGQLRLAFQAALAKSGAATTSRLTVDGSLGADAVRIELESAGSAHNWRAQPLEATATLASGDAARALRVMLGGDAAGKTTRGRARAPNAATAGRIVVRASGRPENGMRTYATFATDETTAVLDGMARLTANEQIGIEATVALSAKRAGALLDPLLPEIAPRVAELPFEGRLRIVRNGQDWRVEGEQLRLGPVELAASLDIAAPLPAQVSANGGPAPGAVATRISGTLSASSVALPSLMALLYANPVGAVLPAADPWPERSFQLAALAGLDVRLAVSASRFEAAAGLASGPATFKIAIADGRVGIDDFAAAVLGGRLSGSVAFVAAPAGVETVGRLALAGGKLDRLGGGRLGAGDTSGTLDFSGTALSPRALASSLKGSGRLNLEKMKLAGMSTTAIASAALAILTTTGEIPDTADAIAKALDAGSLDVGDRSLELALADGALRVAALVVEGPGGRAVNRITLDVAALALESDWRIEAAPLTTDAGVLEGRRLPPVQIIYGGALAESGTLPRRISSDSLIRELTVLKMERDVRELERVRREDEDRARADEERRRQEIELRQRQAEEARRMMAQPPTPSAQPLISGAPQPPQPMTVTSPDPSAPANPQTVPAGAPSGSTPQPAKPGVTPAPPLTLPPQPAVKRPPPRPRWQPFEGNR